MFSSFIDCFFSLLFSVFLFIDLFSPHVARALARHRLRHGHTHAYPRAHTRMRTATHCTQVQAPKNVRELDNRQVRSLAGGLCCVSGKEAVNTGEADCSDSVADAVESAQLRDIAAANEKILAAAAASADDGLRRDLRRTRVHVPHAK